MPEKMLEALAGMMKMNLREISKARKALMAAELRQQVLFQLVASGMDTTVDKVQFDSATGTWAFEPPAQPENPER